MLSTPEHPYRQQLRDIAAETAALRQQLAEIVIHQEGAPDIVASLSVGWQPLTGRPGVRIFHVPNPDGQPGLYMAVCAIEPGTTHAGAHIDQSQLIALLEGDIECNGRTYRRGEFLWLAPGEPSSWTVHGGYLAVILYDAPPPDIDPELLNQTPYPLP